MLRSGLKLSGRYRLDARIGAGGMGEVWRAVDDVLGRVVAVKAMLPDVADEPDFARRFLAEAKAMASVNHPAVASIHDYGRSDGVTFLVMEFIDGESLAEVLRRSGRLSPTDTMRLVTEAADGLQAVHACGIVHRDIKPANLLIRRNGSLLITDFGISRTRDGTHLTASGAILGTPTYLSPEQVLGQPATALSDIYSLGLTAYECLAGHRPFAGDNPYAVALQRVRTAPRPIGGAVPRPVRTVVERALATEPAHRWPSAAALADAARAATDARPLTSPASAAPISPGTPPPPAPAVASAPPVHAWSARLSRRRWSIAAALLTITLIGGVAGWRTIDAGDTDRSTGSTAGIGPGQPSTGPTDAAARQAGLASCGAVFCPTTALCWGGLTSISGNAMPPRRIDCAESHAWETFSVTYLPADAVDVPQDELMARAEIASACSVSVLASRGGAGTTGWVREAWPVQFTGTDVWMVHCLARPETGERSSSAFPTR